MQYNAYIEYNTYGYSSIQYIDIKLPLSLEFLYPCSESYQALLKSCLWHRATQKMPEKRAIWKLTIHAILMNEWNTNTAHTLTEKCHVDFLAYAPSEQAEHRKKITRHK